MECIICGEQVKTYLIGKTPIAGYFASSIKESFQQPIFELNMRFCPRCNFSRYQEFEEADAILSKMYKEQPATYSLTSKNLDYVNLLVELLKNKYDLSSSSSVVEIGCNDGTLLNLFKEKVNCNVLGIEPSTEFREVWEKRKINVVNDFFNSDIAKEFEKSDFDLIIIRHVLEHIKDLDSFMNNLYKMVKANTRLIIEVPHMPTVLRNKRIDNMGYSHLNYFSIKSLNALMAKYSLFIEEYKLVGTDGGSMLCFIGKGEAISESLFDNIVESDFIQLQNFIASKKIELEEKLSIFNKNELIGYGGGPKGQHLINIFSLDRFIDIVVNDIDALEGKYLAGTKICLKKPSDYLNKPNLKAVINLAPTHRETILSKIPKSLKLIDVID